MWRCTVVECGGTKEPRAYLDVILHVGSCGVFILSVHLGVAGCMK
jgi:hypothetical protein